MPGVYIPNPIAALPPSEALFRPVPPAQTGGIIADAIQGVAGAAVQGIQGYQAAKANKANLEATADFLDARGNSAAADLFRKQAGNINPFFSSPAGSGGGGSGGGGAFGSSGLVKDILRHDLTLDEIEARKQAEFATQNNAFENQSKLSKQNFKQNFFQDLFSSSVPDLKDVESARKFYGGFMQQLIGNGALSPEVGTPAIAKIMEDPFKYGPAAIAEFSDRLPPQMRQKAMQDQTIFEADLQAQRKIREAEKLKAFASQQGLELSGINSVGLTYRRPDAPEEPEVPHKTITETVTDEEGNKREVRRSVPMSPLDLLDPEVRDLIKESGFDFNPSAFK